MTIRCAAWRRCAAALLILTAPSAVTADVFYDRLRLAPAERAAVAHACGADRVCAAQWLAGSDPKHFRLLPVRHPSTDVIRWVESSPSLARRVGLKDGRLLVELRRFGRTLLREWQARIPQGATLVLDLRRHPGGDFERMLELAGRLIGAEAAVVLETERGPHVRVAGRAAVPIARVDAVLIGPGTASSAEVLAALLARAGARLCGTRSRGKDWLEAVVPVSHDLRLGARVAAVRVEGVSLAGGLHPTLSVEACLAGLGTSG